MSADFYKNTFGLDISEQALRIIQLKKKRKQFAIAHFGELAIPAGLIENGVIIKPEKFSGYIKQLTEKTFGRNSGVQHVVCVLPESRTFIKLLRTATTDPHQIAAAAAEELQRHIPVELNEIYFDYQIINQNNNGTEVLVGAAPRVVVDSYITALEQANLTPLVLEIEAASITRALFAAPVTGAKIIIDFGAVRTGLIMYDKKIVQFTTSASISGNIITATIAQTLKITAQQAEKAKIVCGLDEKKCEGALREVLTEQINNLIAEIKKAIVFYRQNFKDPGEVSEIILCGGGANFSNITTVLGNALGINVTIGNPLAQVVDPKHALPANKTLSYTSAIGLAMRVFKKNGITY